MCLMFGEKLLHIFEKIVAPATLYCIVTRQRVVRLSNCATATAFSSDKTRPVPITTDSRCVKGKL
jgi:hypothetical protein